MFPCTEISFFCYFWFLWVLAIQPILSLPKGGPRPNILLELRLAVYRGSAVVGCGHSLECRGGEGFRREWIMHLELSRARTTVPHLFPQELWRYHGRYHGRYDGTTPVPSGGTTDPTLYPEVVACEVPVMIYTEITPGKMNIVPRAGTRVVPSYLVEVYFLHSIHLFCCLIKQPGEAGSPFIGNSQRGRGKTYRAILGGGKTYHKAPPSKTSFGGLRKVGFVWSVPVSSKENDIA